MKFLSDILARAGLVVNGTVTLNSVANATIDTDKFLTIDSGVVKFRTGVELLSDIGGQPLLTNPITGTGTAGQVAFYTGTTVISGDSGLFWDNTNKRLGISTTSPYTSLQVGSGSGAKYISIVDTADAAYNIGYIGRNGDKLHIGFSNSNTSISERNAISIDSPTLYVGIGVSAPVNRLQVGSMGSTGFSGNHLAFGNGTAATAFFQGSTSTQMYLSTFLAIMPAGSGTGNLVVGSLTNSGYRLDVVGTFRATSTVTFDSIANAASNTDRFLVSDAGVIRYRTAAQLFADIGAQTSLNGTGFVRMSGTTVSYITGTSSQFVKADGSLDSSTYLTSASASSTYVPYTGATTSLNLGTNNITAQNYISDGNGSTTGGYFALKQYSSSNSGIPGYTSLYAVTQNSLYIRYSQTGGTQKNVELSAALLGTTTRQFVFPDNSGTFALTTDIPSLSGYVQGSGTTNYLPKFTGTSTIGNSQIFDNGTNVGIGTASPSDKLSIAGSTATTFGLSLEPSGWNGAKHRFVVPISGNTSILSWNWNGSARDFASYGSSFISLTDNVITFNNGTGNPSEVGRFNGTNFGIGTTSPTGRLNVITSGTGFTPSATGPIGGSQNTRAHFQGGEPGIMLSSDISPTTGGQTGTQAYQLGLQIGFYAVNDVRNQIYYGNGPLTFVYSGNQGVSVSEYMRITSGGNVGIGLTNPSYKLHVVGSTDIINATSTSSNARINIGHSSNGGYIGYANIGAGDAANTFYITNGSGVIGNGIVMNNAGNVGIGTTSPVYRLEVQNTTGDNHIAAIGTAPSINLASANTGPANWGTVGMATATNNYLIGAIAGDLTIVNRGTTAGNILFGFGSAERMRLTSAGQLRLNTYTSSSAWTGTAVATLGVDSSGNVITITGGGGSSQWTTTGSNIYYTTGNVAIGTTSATSRLTLAPPAVTNASTIEFTSTDNAVISAYYSLTFAVNNSNTQSGRTINFSRGGKGYGDQAGTMMVIQADTGRVGIGTTSPTHQLSLSRSAEAAAYQININSEGGISTGNFTGIRFSQDSTASTELGNIRLHYFSSGATALSLGTRYATQAIYIDNTTDGKVGIGLTSLLYGKLSISSGNFNGIRIDTNAGYDAISIGGTGALAVDAPGVQGGRFYVANGGNTGIGTNNPSKKLHILTGDNEGIFLQGTGGGIWMDIKSAAGKTWSYGAQNDGCGIYNRTDGVYRLFISDSGATTFTSTVTTKSASTAASLGGFAVMGAGEFMSTGSLAGYFFENRSGGTVTSSSNWYGWYATSAIVRLYNGSTDLLSINGATGATTFTSSITCTSLTETSTIKIKENVVSLDQALTKVEKLRPVTYNKIGSTTTEIGLIAEEVSDVYPEFVQYDNQGNPTGVNYSRLTAVLIESVKELKKEIEILKQKN